MKRLPSRTFPVFITTLLLLAPEVALARAGGGGSHGKGSWLNLIALPIVLIYSAIITHQVRKKSQACKELLARLEKQDPAWDLDAIRRRVSQVFFKVQEAWMERDQNIAKDCMSKAIFDKHKMQTDQMIAQHRRNVLEDINLIETDIVDVEDFADNKRDRFWVYLKGAMKDFMVDDRTRDIVSGKDSKESFTELWKFTREGDTWVLDEIDQTVSLFDLRGFKATTDSSAV
jgi:predicted lipid-binding transport protein (Tim44 family)